MRKNATQHFHTHKKILKNKITHTENYIIIHTKKKQKYNTLFFQQTYNKNLTQSIPWNSKQTKRGYIKSHRKSICSKTLVRNYEGQVSTEVHKNCEKTGRVKQFSLKCGQKHLNLEHEFIATFILPTNTKICFS